MVSFFSHDLDSCMIYFSGFLGVKTTPCGGLTRAFFRTACGLGVGTSLRVIIATRLVVFFHQNNKIQE